MSVLRSRELKSKWERMRFRELRGRRARRKWGCGDSDVSQEEASKEESVTQRAR